MGWLCQHDRKVLRFMSQGSIIELTLHMLCQVDDLLAFSKEIRLQHNARLPAFVGGQSMGALAALHAVLRDQSAWDGIILGTATIDVEWTPLLRSVSSSWRDRSTDSSDTLQCGSLQ